MNETFEKIWQEIDKAKSILLTLHPKADADSVGSNLGLMWALESLTPQLPSGQGKKVTVIAGDGPIPSYLKPAPGYERIVNKNIFEVNPEDYDLFLILDLSWLDRLTNKGEFKLPKNWRVINIDHHQGANLVYRQAGLPAQVSWVDTQMPAVGVMIYDLLKFRNIPLTYEISANLILAISGDTGGYKYAGVNGALFTRLADLIEYVPNYSKLIF
ncbi:MAG: DHH family phosphoesterase, partial [Patescibacteria group bacterium]